MLKLDCKIESDIKTYLNGEYLSTITTNQDKIVPHTWSIGAVTSDNSDLADQINDENGTQSQLASVGLITVSEYLRANTNTEQCGNLSLNNSNTSICKTTDWIFNTIPLGWETYLWTISPWNSGNDAIFVIENDKESVYIPGDVSLYYAYYSGGGVSPVLYLSSDITLMGDGSSNNPYVIS